MNEARGDARLPNARVAQQAKLEPRRHAAGAVQQRNLSGNTPPTYTLERRLDDPPIIFPELNVFFIIDI